MVHIPKVAVMMKLGISRLDMHNALARIDPKKYLQADKKLNTILKQLNKQFSLGIITNILNVFLFKILNAIEIDKSVFKYIVSVDNTNNSKPHPEPFQKAIILSGTKANECVYVGDSLTKDIIPAKKVGMKTIWVNKKFSENINADHIIPSIHDIKQALK